MINSVKRKVHFFGNSQLYKEFGAVVSVISTIASLLVLFIDVPINLKALIGTLFLVLLCSIYVYLWHRANNMTKKTLKINSSTVELKKGDLFTESGLKVIAFNEYFDTYVDEHIIASSSLNGQFIRKNIADTVALDEAIANDNHVQSKRSAKNTNRLFGKKQKYSLGTVYVYNEEYLLTAFSHFDDNNRAYLTMGDFLRCLIELWNEIDQVYAGRSVVIPLLGSGITRFKDYSSVNDQELLSILIWSYKVSKIKFTYPAKVTIVIHPGKMDKVNFYDLKEEM